MFGGNNVTVTLEQSLVNREKMIKAAHREIVGPSEINEYSVQLNVSGNIELNGEEAYKNYYWLNNGIKEEVLQYEYPSRRYAAGVLFPGNTTVRETIESEAILDNDVVEVTLPKREQNLVLEEETEEIPIQSDEHLPSSLGMTCNISKDTNILNIIVQGAIYKPHNVVIKDKGTRKWWLRERIYANEHIEIKKLASDGISKQKLTLFNLAKEEVNKLMIDLYIQVRKVEGEYLTTISIVNDSHTGKKLSGQADEFMLFQTELIVRTDEKGEFKGYPKHYQRNLPITTSELNDELLYRNKINYAFGHGCSTTWKDDECVREIKTTFVPTYETTSMTPDVEVEVNGNIEKVNIKMIDLVNATTYKELEDTLLPLLQGYEEWIKLQEQGIADLDSKLQEVAKHNMTLCSNSLLRMKKGLKHLTNPTIRKAFNLANEAILLQQVNGKKIRTVNIQGIETIFDFQYKETVFKTVQLQKSTNSWRAFQIAFFLMSIDSIANDESLEREIVDLIWFPTGGGKTEAYLGVAAFEMFYRRIINPKDAGVDVIMRYTLRLLTADQFQRSSRLMCAMEVIRRDNSNLLGQTPYSIGMWVGSSTSPNSYKEAFTQLGEIKSGRRDGFVLDKCPWCGCKMGKLKVNKSKRYLVLGYKKNGQQFISHCLDKECDFFDEIPVYFIDEAIYEKQPTFLIGTVDKFVQLTWNPKARSIFGIGKSGEQVVTPPNLIIQDELHLISGPLGTLAGLYEVVIEEFCTKIINGKRMKPKIISATATIKEFENQAKSLFGRTEAKLFPSPGLDIDDSFFAKVATDKDGIALPGRKYVGIYTTNVGLLMSQVKVFSSVLEEGKRLPEKERDPYWTLLAFYNSLRDLGAGINLCSMDIPTYMNAIKNREGYPEMRFIQHPLELTSRIQSNKIAATLDKLKIELTSNNAKNVLDVCLASNIIEVGVDIDRLSLMAVVGQPKTTAQYIQVTGRVGRRWFERPGVIFTLYSNRSSRDKSHFEHFNEYHQRLYAQVETTSVTPFSDASLDRGLAAIVIAFLRQRFSKTMAIEPNVEGYKEILIDVKFKQFIRNIKARLKLIDPEQNDYFDAKYREFHDLIMAGNYNTWKADDGMQGMMYISGNPAAPELYPDAIPMINSLRSVDATSYGEITTSVNKDHAKEEIIEDALGDLLK